MPPERNAEFVAAMEDVIQARHRPFDPETPVVRVDESNKRLVSSATPSIPVAPGKPLREDHEYVRRGVADIFMAVEPMAGKRWVSVTERRTSVDWSLYIQDLLDNKYPDAFKVVMVMDNLNTHAISSLYKTFPPDEALRLANRLELHCAPKHGGWLNMAEIELSVLAGQCLNRRIGDI
ncbi:MAG: IS630 family transposase, partial [Deltaproteobacteria bacterium]|nr:IS630 family transposase [Deltaproteobacteria bacterium]